MLMLILTLRKKYLNFNYNSLKFLNEISITVYILHQVVLVVVTFYLIPLNLWILQKFLLIIAVSIIVTFGLTLLTREVNILRFLFGMRLKKKKITTESKS